MRLRKTHLTGYARVLELLKLHRIVFEIKEHRPVRSMGDVKEVLDVSPGDMVKSILIAADPCDHHPRDADLYLIAVPVDRKLDMAKVANVVDKRHERLRLATQIEVEDLTGFRVASIPPFGHPKKIPVILDRLLAAKKKVWCGTGKATESLGLSVEDLKKLSTFTVADVSKAG